MDEKNYIKMMKMGNMETSHLLGIKKKVKKLIFNKF